MTINHNYDAPQQGTLDWHLPLNDNFVALDRDVEVRDTEANLTQYEPQAGAKFMATDSGRRFLGDGSQWTEAPADPRVVLPNTEVDPTEASVGDVWYRSDLDEVRAQFPDGPAVLTPGDESSGDPDPSTALAQSSLDSNSEIFDFWDMKYKQEDRWEAVSQTDDGSPPHSGTGMERIVIEKGTSGGPTHQRYIYKDHAAFGNTAPKEAHHRVWLYFDPGWRAESPWSKAGGKIPCGFDGTWDTGEGYGGNPSDGTNGWSARMGWQNDTSDPDGPLGLRFYVYHADMSGSYGDSFDWNAKISKREWHQLDCYLKMNSGKNTSDGELRGWLDGDLKFKKTDFNFAWASPFDRLYAAWPGWFYGGGYDAPVDCVAYIDSVEFWDSRQL